MTTSQAVSETAQLYETASGQASREHASGPEEHAEAVEEATPLTAALDVRGTESCGGEQSSTVSEDAPAASVAPNTLGDEADNDTEASGHLYRFPSDGIYKRRKRGEGYYPLTTFLVDRILEVYEVDGAQCRLVRYEIVASMPSWGKSGRGSVTPRSSRRWSGRPGSSTCERATARGCGKRQ